MGSRQQECNVTRMNKVEIIRTFALLNLVQPAKKKHATTPPPRPLHVTHTCGIFTEDACTLVTDDTDCMSSVLLLVHTHDISIAY